MGTEKNINILVNFKQFQRESYLGYGILFDKNIYKIKYFDEMLDKLK